FIEEEKPFAPQAFMLGTIFFILAIMIVISYALLASYVGTQLRLPGIQQWTKQIGGGLLIGAGGMTIVSS
ncbi:MAG: LysE family translocator, partial [SAR324 cluster bacterium]|nr:LysE family translocator [SAR324 cluster bacterium]